MASWFLAGNCRSRLGIAWHVHIRPIWTVICVLLAWGASWGAHQAIVRAQGFCTICISQVYGGGGNNGAPFNADFIELFNATAADITLDGWSVEYASATSTSWQAIPLTGQSIRSSSYLLIQLKSGDNGGQLPAPDVLSNLSIAAESGKVRLLSASTIVDLLGYGSANEYEGQPAPKGSNTQGLLRQGAGCVDTNNNSVDFTTSSPSPRNSSVSANPCVLATPTPTETPTDTPTDTPIPTPTETATSTATETPTDAPARTSTETATSMPTETPTTTLIPTPTQTATSTATETPTDTPIPTPTETATSTPIETSTETPVSTPTETATSTPTEALTGTPIQTPDLTFTVPATDTPEPAPTATPTPRIRLSEIMVDPQAADDTIGEFIEVANADTVAVNLRGWRLVDSANRSHVIATDLWIEPDSYLVLTRGDSVALSDYLHSDYRYTSLQLGNTSGSVTLHAPGSAPGDPAADSLTWGSAVGLRTVAGASFERIDLSGNEWVVATTPWSEVHTDKGSPGRAVSGGLPTPTPMPDSSLIATPGIFPTPTPTPTVGPAPRIRLSEIMVDPQAVGDTIGEFIEVANADTVAVNLRGWRLVDSANRSHVIAADLWIEPDSYLVLTRGDSVALSDYLHSDYRYTSLQLGNTSGSVALHAPGSAPSDPAADSLTWGSAVGLRTVAGASFERIELNAHEWIVATTPWSEVHTDRGSPGRAFSGSLPTPTPDGSLIATPGIFPTPTPTPTVGPAPRIRLSEIMVDPQAVGDTIGEFIEVANADTVAVNLRGWRLVDSANRSHVIAADLWIEPDSYLVLTRGDSVALSDYLHPDYRYTSLQLGNTSGSVALHAPGSAPSDPAADSLTWGSAVGLRTVAGASFERIDLNGNEWVVATTPWSEVHTDKGSPGRAFSGSLPTPTPIAAPTLLPDAWQLSGQAGVLQIDEVHFQGSDGEFIALVNLGAEALSLAGWMLGDAETPGGSEGIYRLPDDVQLASGAIYVAARNAAAFRREFGRLPDAAWQTSDGVVPLLQREPRLGRGSMVLNDSGDEVVLLNPAGKLVDAVAFKKAAYATVFLEGYVSPSTGLSLQRVPGADFATTRDLRHRFLAAPPQPFERHSLPLPAGHALTKLDGVYQAMWGSLGAASNFSPGFTAPPHYLLAEAAAHGLDFLAIADAMPAHPILTPNGVTSLPAWRWREETEEIVVYSDDPPADRSRAGIAAYLAGAGAPWQFVAGEATFGAAPLLEAPRSAPPSSLKDWFAAWQRNGIPAIPAGNSNPDLPGAPQFQPRYTGLAVISTDTTGLRDALIARRGWVTTAPGLWLTMHAELAGGQRVWMGQRLAPANQVTIHIAYGDRGGEVAGLAIWQDGRPIHQLDRPSADGRWTVTLPAIPGAILTAVATQFDGDFAVTAPFFIEPGESGTLLLNEVLPAPRNDYNGDGIVDSDDEYLELYNPGRLPMALLGWMLMDGDDETTARRTIFGQGRYLGGGERLLLLRKANRLTLRNDAGVVRLLDPNGVERDRVEWDESLTRGRSISRIPDGGAWVWSADATPGEANANTGVNHFAPWPNTPPAPPSPSRHSPPLNLAAEATVGQAGGPPGSIAQSKLAGLGASVEVRAVVVAPPGLFNSNIYVADVAGDGVTAGIGINVYLRRGEFPPLEAGDLVLLRGRLDSFRGETELIVDTPERIWRIESGAALQPLLVRAGEIGEPLEGRLVTFRGVVTGWQGDSFFLGDPGDPEAEPVRVTVRSTLSWKRPYVKKGEVWQATGLVSQFAREAPWNGGYRILVRWQHDLVKERR